LSITVLLLIGPAPLKVMILVFCCEIFIPNVCAVWCKACSPLCKLSPEFAITTWWSANNVVFVQNYSTSQKTILNIILAAVRTWNLTMWYLILCHLIFLFL
jgi:hypothetical protein